MSARCEELEIPILGQQLDSCPVDRTLVLVVWQDSTRNLSRVFSVATWEKLTTNWKFHVCREQRSKLETNLFLIDDASWPHPFYISTERQQGFHLFFSYIIRHDDRYNRFVMYSLLEDRSPTCIITSEVRWLSIRNKG